MLSEYIEEKQCRRINQEFRENMVSYKSRQAPITDEEWMKQLILRRCPDTGEEAAGCEAEEIMVALNQCRQNQQSIEKANMEGISKENWLASQLQETAIGMSADQYSAALKGLNDALYKRNQELDTALDEAQSGHIQIKQDEAVFEEDLERRKQNLQPQDRWSENGYYYSTKEYAAAIGKNVGVMALQMAAVTVGAEMVSRSCYEMENKTNPTPLELGKGGTDYGVKVVIAGTIHTSAKRKLLSFLPKNLSISFLAGIAFVGVEYANVYFRMAQKSLPMVRGLSRMEQIATSIIGGLCASELVQGSMDIPMIGVVMGVAVSAVAMMAGYTAGQDVGENMLVIARKVAERAGEMGKNALKMEQERRGKMTADIQQTVSLYG